ncbi:MAG: pyruvate formate lyase family protein, partial [Chloroflexota bacterium]
MSTVAEEMRVTPWWEKAGAPWRGKILENAILQPDDPAEQRIQAIRQDLMRWYNTKDRRLSTNRARLLTESYQATEGESPAIRRAKAFAHVLRHIPIVIAPHQLLAGGASSGPGVVEIEPEFTRIRDVPAPRGTGKRVLDDTPLWDADRIYVFPEEEKQVFEETIWPYWKDRCRGAYALRELNQFHAEALSYSRSSNAYLMPLITTALIHTVQDYHGPITRGLNTITADIRSSAAAIDLADASHYQEELERRDLYEAMLICADGVIAYAERCGEEAERLAREENDSPRKSELLEIARICHKVPAEPAATFWEALQALHILRSATAMVEGGNSHSVGRLDQWLLPYLEQDLASGRISLKQAQELLECLFLKWNETRDLILNGSSVAPGKGNNDKINLGGMDVYGNDTTNRLSYMLLEAHAHVHLNDPNLALRVHVGTPDDLLLRALEVLRLGGGLPNLL